MKYIRTYGDYNSWKLDYSDTSRGFRLKPTLYRYPHGKDNILLELDDPRKHGDSTYMEIYLDSDVEFSFYISNAPGDTQTTMTCTIDWGDGTVETKTITKDDKGFKLAHNYVANSYKIELYNVERDYSIPGDTTNYAPLVSHPSTVNRLILGNGVTRIGPHAFDACMSLTSVHIPESVNSMSEYAFWYCYSLTYISLFSSTAPSIDDEYDGYTMAFENFPTNGTLHIKPGATGYSWWLNVLPSGWVITEDL